MPSQPGSGTDTCGLVPDSSVIPDSSITSKATLRQPGDDATPSNAGETGAHQSEEATPVMDQDKVLCEVDKQNVNKV